MCYGASCTILSNVISNKGSHVDSMNSPRTPWEFILEHDRYKQNHKAFRQPTSEAPAVVLCHLSCCLYLNCLCLKLTSCKQPQRSIFHSCIFVCMVVHAILLIQESYTVL